MATKAGKTEKLTILLIRNSFTLPQDALRFPATLTRLDLKAGSDFSGEFWHAKPSPKTPKWQSFIQPVLATPLGTLRSATVSAVLFVNCGGHIFALTFGYGRNLLKADCFVPNFGLKIALNRLDHKRIRSMDLKTYEDMVLSTRKQASTSSEMATFGLDVARDLLRAVTGEPADANFAKRVTGADACTINVAITAGGLGKKCEQLLKAYRDNAYQTHFDWIDHLCEVRDKQTVDGLNGQLINAIKSQKDDKLHLAPAEPIDWQMVDKFRITGTRSTEYDDLSIDDYVVCLGDKKKKALTVEALKTYRVSIRWTGYDEFASAWPLFNCLVWETTSGGRFYSLADGRWFEIEKKFAARVKKFISDLPNSTLKLPDAIVSESEEDYNERVANADPQLFCLDRKLVKPLDAATSIEFCDLLSKGKHIVHVKKKTRSATLSHLFAQGSVSARAFLQDGTVRDQVIKHLNATPIKAGFASLIPSSTKMPTANEYTITYAVIAKPNANWPISLPFFSQLNLMQHATLLQGLGFRVGLRLIEEK